MKTVPKWGYLRKRRRRKLGVSAFDVHLAKYGLYKPQGSYFALRLWESVLHVGDVGPLMRGNWPSTRKSGWLFRNPEDSQMHIQSQ